MTSISPPVDSPLARLRGRKGALREIRERAAQLFERGATGVQVAAFIAEATDGFVRRLLDEELADLPEAERRLVMRHCAVLAVGGTGRGELCLYSDLDLLFLYEPLAKPAFERFSSAAVRAFWDAGVKLGHAVRTVKETIALARTEPEIATAVVEARRLWGASEVADALVRQFERKVIASRLRAFVDDCLAARTAETQSHGDTVQQLEPDVKCSHGGLRDLHLLRWVGYAHYGVKDIDSLRLKGAISREDSLALKNAYEFLLKIRVDLHLHADKPQDRLTREEQLRITEQRGIEGTPAMRAVEVFMQTYFRHGHTMADIVQKFVQQHRPRTVAEWLVEFTMTHRSNGMYRVGPSWIDVLPRYRETVRGSLTEIVRLYYAAALYGVMPKPRTTADLKEAVARLPGDAPPEALEVFLRLLGCTTHLGPTLRELYDIGALELLLPEMRHARCLLQFNQYHSYTVDEHTLRAVRACTRFEEDEGPLGQAYRLVQHKEILHLALLLHDIGKGYDEDHCIVGKRIAERVARRFGLPEHRGQALALLVEKHLEMADLAFRRDTTDPTVVVPFAQSIASPDTLRMLFVLSAADITAVGPGVWTDWKAGLLADLYERANYVLSGRHFRHQEERRLAEMKTDVRRALGCERNGVKSKHPAPSPPSAGARVSWVRVRGQTAGKDQSAVQSVLASALTPGPSPRGRGETDDADLYDWIGRQLDTFPPHYLAETPPERVAEDLAVIRRLERGEFHVTGRFDPATGTVDYRLITHEKSAAGCFHRTVGVLTAQRLEILSAQISTSVDGFVVDSFTTRDGDFDGEVPAERIGQVAAAVVEALRNETAVEPMFQRFTRFTARRSKFVSDLPTRVVLDNNLSPRCTVFDVFAHDRPGLLYTVTRSLFELGTSVMLAKIATHFDQVVDVFYVTDLDGRKITDGERLGHIRDELARRLDEFERDGHRRFA